MKTFQESKEHDWDAKQRAHQFSPAFIYNQIKLNGGGATFIDAFNILTEQGAVLLSDMPYDESSDSTMPNSRLKQQANRYRIANWRRINAQDRSEIRSHLASGFPILIGATVDASFERFDGDGVFKIPRDERVDGGGHAMVVVGYDNDKKAIRVLNSWGREWGDNGMAWIDYESFGRMVREAYVTQDINLDAPNNTNEDQDPGQDPPRLRVAANRPIVTHNSPVTINGKLFDAMKIKPSGKVFGANGRRVTIVARFWNVGRRAMVLAHPAETVFRDVTGQVACGTSPILLDDNETDLSDRKFEFKIPYHALNYVRSGGFVREHLTATIFVYVDGFEVGRSAPTAFPFDH